MESDVLHPTDGDGAAGIAGVSDAPLDVLGIVGVLDERDVALRCQFDEAVERAVDAMHVVQRS